MTKARARRVLAGAASALVVAGALASLWARKSLAHPAVRAELPSGDAALELRVPHAQANITLDGDTDDPGWQLDVARTNAFVVADGSPARPHSEARFAWGDGHLYVMLYAADEDIHAAHEVPDGPVWYEDSFHMVFSDGAVERSFDLSPLGTLTDGIRPAAAAAGSARPFDSSWSSGAHVSHEVDGTPNQPDDEDEEWVLEMAIPFEALGLTGKPGERVALSMHRCDTIKATGARACGSWGEGEKKGVLVLE